MNEGFSWRRFPASGLTRARDRGVTGRSACADRAEDPFDLHTDGCQADAARACARTAPLRSPSSQAAGGRRPRASALPASQATRWSIDGAAARSAPLRACSLCTLRTRTEVIARRDSHRPLDRRERQDWRVLTRLVLGPLGAGLACARVAVRIVKLTHKIGNWRRVIRGISASAATGRWRVRLNSVDPSEHVLGYENSEARPPNPGPRMEGALGNQRPQHVFGLPWEQL